MIGANKAPRMARVSGNYFYLAPMTERQKYSSAEEGYNTSPVQRLMSKKPKDNLSRLCRLALLKPWVENSDGKHFEETTDPGSNNVTRKEQTL